MRRLAAAAGLWTAAVLARAERIADMDAGGGGWVDQAYRFLQMSDPSVRMSAAGSLLLGALCGALGSFIVLRGLSLIGDTLGHAVLPGVAVGFLAAGAKAPGPIFIGAIAAGAAAAGCMSAATRYSRVKPDAAMGIVLSGFFGLGIVLLTRIQKMPSFGNQSGLDKFLFGQAAAMNIGDIIWLASVAAVCLSVIWVFFKQFAAVSFDEIYAHSIGIPIRLFHWMLMFMLTAAVVVSIQAAGVVLVSAMLVIPASTAYLLTDRLPHLTLMSAAIGALSGLAGSFISFLGPSLPTGPLMVLCASFLFALAYGLSPRHGLLTRMMRRRANRKRAALEDALRGLLEGGAVEPGVGAALVRQGFAQSDGGSLILTEEGRARAERIRRNRQLWELYLTREAEIAPDHAQEDSEEIEHILGTEIVQRLEEELEEELEKRRAE